MVTAATESQVTPRAATSTLEEIKREHLIVDELDRRGIRPTRSYGNRVIYSCPLPGHEDHEPSFTVYTDTNTFRCYGCDRHGTIIDLVAALDARKPAEVIREITGRGGGVVNPPKQHRNSATVGMSSGCTVVNLAEHCGLPVEHLRSYGITDITYLNAPAVRIPFRDVDGNELAVQHRVNLEKNDGGERFRWKKGSRPTLYGWPTLSEAVAAGYVIICEGASDYWTLRYHGFPALGLPSATGWKEEYAEALLAIESIFVVVEPDAGGQAVREAFKTSRLCERVKLIYMSDDTKDPNDLHRKGPESFAAAFNRLLAAAVPLRSELAQETSATTQSAWELCEDLAHEPRIMDRFAESMERRGVAGEERLTKILYLALTSRHLSRPVSVAVKGPSSGGKSYLVERTLDYFPSSAYFALSAMSDRALAYMNEPLAHRHLVVFEAAGMAGEVASYLIRSLLSEGCIRYSTVEKTAEGLKERRIEQQGPTGLIVTTTRASLHPENETRLLSLTVTDTPEQTRSVLRAIADESHGEDKDSELQEWLALQTHLDLTGPHEVTIPYAHELAKLIPPVAVRLRRDFRTILDLVRAHALLHQASRERDQEGRIVATVEDYAVVRDLVADLIADGVGTTVSSATRETIMAVSELRSQHGNAVSNKQVAARLGIDPASASRRLRVAADKGYLRNLETRQGVSARWELGEPLPEDRNLLPSPEVLSNRCTVAPLREGIRTPLPLSVPTVEHQDYC